MSDRNEVLQKMSDVYGDLIEAKSYIDNFDLEISRLIDQLKYGYPENKFDVISKLNQVYRQDREIEARFNELEKQMNKIIEELKSFAEENE